MFRRGCINYLRYTGSVVRPIHHIGRTYCSNEATDTVRKSNISAFKYINNVEFIKEVHKLRKKIENGGTIDTYRMSIHVAELPSNTADKEYVTETPTITYRGTCIDPRNYHFNYIAGQSQRAKITRQDENILDIVFHADKENVVDCPRSDAIVRTLYHPYAISLAFWAYSIMMLIMIICLGSILFCICISVSPVLFMLLLVYSAFFPW